MIQSRKRMRRERIRHEYGENPFTEEQMTSLAGRMDSIAIYHKEKEQANGESAVDDVTWNDLEMDEVFARINHTRSYIGEQMLYHRLHDTDDGYHGDDRKDRHNQYAHDANGRRDWDKFEKQVAYCMNHEEERIDMEERLCDIGKAEGGYQLITFLAHPNLWVIHSGYLLRILQLLLIGFLTGSILTDNMLFVGGLVCVVLVNLSIYMVVKQRYEVYLHALGSTKQLYEFARMLVRREQEQSLFTDRDTTEAVRQLKCLSGRIASWQQRKSASLSGDIGYMVQDYLFGITLYDVAAFNHIMKIINHKQSEVLRLCELAGQVDMAISVASYRKSMQVWCMPDFVEEHVIDCKELAHPLLSHPITNDICLKARAMVTGPNASGKSTFMKALAINVVLAQTIHTCSARSVCMPAVQIMTSMALRDDILTGESYYIREAKYLKRMLDCADDTQVHLFIIDEILKGTNTSERLASSAAVLRYLADTKSFVVVATHDMELVDDTLGSYENYYFETEISREDITFDYMLHTGVGGTSNAIALLELLHFPQQVVKEARDNIIQRTRKR